jgi:hypothetical protein
MELRNRALEHAAKEDGLVAYPHKFHVDLYDIPAFRTKYEHLQPKESAEADIVSIGGSFASS